MLLVASQHYQMVLDQIAITSTQITMPLNIKPQHEAALTLYKWFDSLCNPVAASSINISSSWAMFIPQQAAGNTTEMWTSRRSTAADVCTMCCYILRQEQTMLMWTRLSVSPVTLYSQHRFDKDNSALSYHGDITIIVILKTRDLTLNFQLKLTH